jgi:hypothetical protein
LRQPLIPLKGLGGPPQDCIQVMPSSVSLSPYYPSAEKATRPPLACARDVQCKVRM